MINYILIVILKYLVFSHRPSRISLSVNTKSQENPFGEETDFKTTI